MKREYIVEVPWEPDQRAAEECGFQELIRCKDCRYWQDNNGGYPNPDCPWGKDETPDPDDYCSFGEREDDYGPDDQHG